MHLLSLSVTISQTKSLRQFLNITGYLFFCVLDICPISTIWFGALMIFLTVNGSRESCPLKNKTTDIEDSTSLCKGLIFMLPCQAFRFSTISGSIRRKQKMSLTDTSDINQIINTYINHELANWFLKKKTRIGFSKSIVILYKSLQISKRLFVTTKLKSYGGSRILAITCFLYR